MRISDWSSDVCSSDLAMKAIFATMYRDCTDVAFVIDGVLRQDDTAMVKWTFRFRPQRFGGAQPWIAIGVTELHLAPDGRIAAHLDYWDAGSQFYARLPLLGPLVRFVRRRPTGRASCRERVWKYV